MSIAARTRAALVEALEDEYKARATYRAVIEAFGRVRPFVNILASEQRHIDALARLFERHGLALPPDRAKAGAPASLLEACRTGVAAEIENAAMYDRLIAAAEGHPEIQRVFRRLQDASQNRHLPAFERGVERESRSDVRGGSRASGQGRGQGPGRGPRSGPGGGPGPGRGPASGGGRGRGCGTGAGRGGGGGRGAGRGAGARRGRD